MEDDEDAQSPSRSPTQSASRSASPESSPPPVSTSIVAPSSSPLQDNGGTAEPVTVAAPAPEHRALALALAVPIQQPRSSPAGGGGVGRDDCWSEGATSILIDAWGERYLELSRGNLKQKHWQEVADAVTSRDGYTKAPKTDVQCKNRIDTLKKKYKAEKSKISGSGGSSSSWPFFHRLDLLLGPSHKSTATSGNIPAAIPIRPPSRRPQPGPQRQRTNQLTVKKAGKSSPPSVSASSADSSDGFPPPRAANGKRQHEHHQEADEEGEEDGGRTAELKELTRAILRFAEVYEKVESSKLRQAMEMEKQRMELTRELELQRMEFLMKTQMELSQLKSHHHGSNRKKKMNDGGGGSSNHQHRNNTSSNSNNSGNNC
ncbi:trihelix transcription factor ASIL2-like [Zingiber officinale]|uniref:Myb/SANT-like DNA-binding domain-containing protein n=1 Tax=Zingiber officinale TaxID=94328 RepID=A0A8J5CD89_ZINOF|nr:trihelix transcription factor ASIL2-like [Zingiber officinale]KAG6474225.1 hypothetical protein ZIOFF_068149 [Zingiber officinale]